MRGLFVSCSHGPDKCIQSQQTARQLASWDCPGTDLVTSSLPAEGWQALFHGANLLHAISLDSTLLDFGSQSRLKSGEHRTLTVTNHTGVKLTAFIAGPLAVTQQQGQANAAPEVFQVRRHHTLPCMGDDGYVKP